MSQDEQHLIRQTFQHENTYRQRQGSTESCANVVVRQCGSAHYHVGTDARPPMRCGEDRLATTCDSFPRVRLHQIDESRHKVMPRHPTPQLIGAMLLDRPPFSQPPDSVSQHRDSRIGVPDEGEGQHAYSGGSACAAGDWMKHDVWMHLRG